MNTVKPIAGTPFEYDERLEKRLLPLQERIFEMRRGGRLNPGALERMHAYFKIKGIYHSNAIEGNALTLGETAWVLQQGLTVTGKTLRDQAEAKNLAQALDYMKNIALAQDRPITVSDLRQIHALILRGIEDEFAGKYRQTEVRISGSKYVPPAPSLLPQQMAELGEYVAAVTDLDRPNVDLPILCAAAAHAWLAQLHPFIDGNGRTARVLMNLILMRRGYPSCIIRREDRLRYYDALEASQVGDLTALIDLVCENIEESLDEWQQAGA